MKEGGVSSYTGCPKKKQPPRLIAIKVFIIKRSPRKFHTVSGTCVALICAIAELRDKSTKIGIKCEAKITSFESQHG